MSNIGTTLGFNDVVEQGDDLHSTIGGEKETNKVTKENCNIITPR